MIIVVNAHNESEDEISRSESAPGLSEVAYRTATVAMDNHSLSSIEKLKTLLGERRAAQDMIRACRKRTEERAACAREEYACDPERRPSQECEEAQNVDFASTVEPYVIDVSFEAIAGERRRRFFLTLPTSFALGREAVQALVDAGGSCSRKILRSSRSCRGSRRADERQRPGGQRAPGRTDMLCRGALSGDDCVFACCVDTPP